MSWTSPSVTVDEVVAFPVTISASGSMVLQFTTAWFETTVREDVFALNLVTATW